jgi:cytochrome c oxidase subunit I+III
VDIGDDRRLRLHYANVRSPGWWGTALALAADATLFASLAFAYLFLWTVSPEWPPAARTLGWIGPAVALALIAMSSAALFLRAYGTAIALALIGGAVEIAALVTTPLSATRHAYDALVITIWIFALVHLAIAVLMAAFVKARGSNAASTVHHRAEPAVTALFWHYTVAQWAVAFVVVHGFPPLALP